MKLLRGDGTVRPFSLDEQWKQVADWHAFLTDDRANEYPVLNGMNYSWEVLEPLYQLNGKKIIERGEELKSIARSPLSALFYFIDLGFYPPPELLLALLDCWEIYEAGGRGRISLEEAFLGRASPKAGNYAKRSAARFRRMMMRYNFDELLREGATRMQAAEAVSAQFGGKPEPESILRMFRGRNPVPVPKPSPEK